MARGLVELDLHDFENNKHEFVEAIGKALEDIGFFALKGHGIEFDLLSQCYKNSEEFFSVISQFPRVKAIIWGHAHQSSEFKFGNIKLFSCPSTAVQFCGPLSIGYNHYTLHANGEINCKTRWLDYC